MEIELTKKQYDKNFYQNNKEKHLKQSKDYYLKNREKILKQSKEYYQKNKEKILKRFKEYRLKNKDKINERWREYYPKRYKEKRTEYAKKHYQENRENILKQQKQYHQKNIKRITTHNRNHTLTTNGKRYHQINKREYLGFCEICDKRDIKLFYHHWNNKNFMEGIWVCQKCHWFVESIDSGCDEKTIKKYLDLKQKIRKEQNNGKSNNQS